MKFATPPIRFLAMVGALWMGGRIWWLLPDAARQSVLPSPAAAERQSSPRAVMPSPRPAPAIVIESSKPVLPLLLAHATNPTAATHPISMTIPVSTKSQTTVSPAPADLPAPFLPPSPTAARSPSRWSGNFYLFAREGDTDALAAGGQLGGGQAGARIAWRLNRSGPTRFALAARIYTPLDDTAGAEAAAGVDFHPLPGQPLRLSVERRFDLGGRGRNAWSAYAAGGFWREVGENVELDGYGQAGLVGGHSADFFTDGTLRVVHRRDIGPSTALRLGAGAWGGAQPGVERLDVGPRAAISLPVAGTTISAAIEGRIRIAGDADPGSSVALTLASDF